MEYDRSPANPRGLLPDDRPQVQPQSAPTLGYQRGKLPGVNIPGTWATRRERFEAGIIDWTVTWIGLFTVVLLTTLITQTDFGGLAVGALWLGLIALADALIGWTFGRANMGLEVCDATGTPASRWQIAGRAVAHRLWLWPLVIIAGLATAAAFGLRPSAFAITVTTGAWILCGAVWVLNSLLVLIGEPTLADRISKTRLKQIGMTVESITPDR